MQDEVNTKVVAIAIKGGRITAEVLKKALAKFIEEIEKAEKQASQPKTYRGKQSIKHLVEQNAAISNIEVTDGNIKSFERTANKYGIDYALKKDTSEQPPRYLVFFKGRDVDVMTQAFKEFSAKTVKQKEKQSLKQKLSRSREQSKAQHKEKVKVKTKDRGVELLAFQPFVGKLLANFMRHLRRDFSDVEGLNQVSGNHLRHLHPLLGGEVSRPLKFLCRRVAGSASERGNIELIVSLFRVEDVGKRLVYSSSDWLDFSNCHIYF